MISTPYPQGRDIVTPSGAFKSYFFHSLYTGRRLPVYRRPDSIHNYPDLSTAFVYKSSKLWISQDRFGARRWLESWCGSQGCG
jgi:hypothetical protein